MPSTDILEDIFARYQSLQRYVGWTAEDAERVRAAGDMVRPSFDALIDDFYNAIRGEPQTARLITGGEEQIERLKQTLIHWVDELFSGVYDAAYVARRYRVGRRHVEIGLRQIYADAAMARLRAGLLETLQLRWPGDIADMPPTARSLNRLIDLELALIEDAYTTERLVEQRHEVRKQSEATFRNLVEAARCVIVILRPDYTLAYFSPFAEQLTGYSAQEVLGQEYFPLFLDEANLAEVRQAFAGVLAGGVPAIGYEHPIVCRNRATRAILWNAQRLEDYEGEPAILAVGHDITDLKGAQEKVLQSERLAAIGQTVTGLAHESRNAFQRSQACLEMLAVELEGQDSELELVHRIQRALDHLHHLYEEVRDYAAPIKLDRQSCNLAHVWRDAWTHLEVLRREKSVKLCDDSDVLDLTCEVDWFRLGQVFRNVLENALSASPAWGAITIKCRETRGNGRSYVEISVRDNGPGFPPAVRERAFDAFFTTKPKGTGLGMAIAKRIVEAHGGRIEVVDSSPGAEIAITLPRS
jgi:two-component system, LuxR family, sensor kinase FixL